MWFFQCLCDQIFVSFLPEINSNFIYFSLLSFSWSLFEICPQKICISKGLCPNQWSFLKKNKYNQSLTCSFWIGYATVLLYDHIGFPVLWISCLPFSFTFSHCRSIFSSTYHRKCSWNTHFWHRAYMELAFFCQSYLIDILGYV